MKAKKKAVTTDAPERVVKTWPAITLAEAEAHLCAPGMRFEMEAITIRGVLTRCWKNIPANLPALARDARASHGDRPFIVLEDERITYDAWFRAVATLAEELSRRGIEKGDRVALVMRNLPEWPVAFFAAAVCGAIVVPLNAWWTSTELQHGLTHSGAKVLICDAERWERIAPLAVSLPDLGHIFVSRMKRLEEPAVPLESIIGAPENYPDLPDKDLPDIEIAPDDDATIFYTSGTSGLPKGAENGGAIFDHGSGGIVLLRAA